MPGTHQRNQTLATTDDLVGKYSLEHPARPQSPAVVQVHVQRADAIVFQHLGAQHPRTVPASVGLGTFEDHSMKRDIMDGASHPQALATSQRTDAGA